jgi:hypothetical protein
MSRLSRILLDMAARIAPPHRRQWIAGLRVEAAMADRPDAWAWGALTTALGQRLAETVTSGLALRLVAGGFVIGLAACFAIFLIVRIPGIEAASARAHRDLPPVALVLTTVVVLLLSGGLAILLSHGTTWLNRYGRALFALGGLSIGYSLSGAVFMKGHGASAFQQQMALLSTLAGPLFIAAAVALLFRRLRLFLVLASGALGMEIAQYGLEWPRMQTSILFIAFFNACAPGLLMLAATGLLVGRKTHGVA